MKMKTASLIVLAALCGVPTASAWAQKPASSSASTILPRLVWNGKDIIASANGAQTPFRDMTDGNICIAPEALAPLGISFMADTDNETVSLVGPSGIIGTVPLRAVPRYGSSRGVFVGAVEAIEAVGGKCEWEPRTNTLHARAVLTSVEILGGQLRVKATLPVIPTITLDNGGRRVLLAFPGAEVGSLPRILSLAAPNIAQARSGQFDDNTARIVLELRTTGGYRTLSDNPKPTTQIVLNPLTLGQAMVMAQKNPESKAAPRMAGSQPSISISIPAKPLISDYKKAAAASTQKKKQSPLSSNFRGVTFRRGSDSIAQFVISADRVPAFRAAQSKGQFTLDLLNTSVAASAVGPLDGVANLPFVKAARMVARSQNVSSLVLSLSRAVCFSVRPNGPGGSLLLELSLPRGAGGYLAGKTVVIDAGHGGHDNGARGVNGTHEKNVALAIAKSLTSVLQDSGANVIMTRSDDTFIPLGERPQMANRMGADFFIAVHADSGDSNHSANGSTVYYHFDNAPCRTLAQCIAERFGDMGSIRTKGVRSDRTIAPNSGFAVLRGAKMVAVLCETGYMSNNSDVRLLNDGGMQKKIAQNIAQGLQDYIEGNPDFDTRMVSPNAGTDEIVPLPFLPEENGTLEMPSEPDPQ